MGTENRAEEQDLYLCSTHALAVYLSPRAKMLDRVFEDALARHNPQRQPANFLAYGDGTVELGRRCCLPLAGYRPCIDKPRARELRRLLGCSLPLNVAVAAPADRRFSETLCCWVHPASVPMMSYVRVAEGIFAATPELAALQASRLNSDLETAVMMSMLCAIYVENPRAKGGLEPRRRVCTKESLAEFPATLLPGSAAPDGMHAYKQALRLCVEKAASPAEIELALMLSLPRGMGGYGLPAPTLNERLEFADGRRGRMYPDLSWQRQGIAVEYQSNANHLEAAQISQDRMRKNQFLDGGIRLFEVSSRQLRDPLELEAVAAMLARALGCRAPETSKSAREARAKTHATIECALDHFGKLWL